MASPFRVRLRNASERLEALAARSSPSVARLIRYEAAAVRTAFERLEGEPCDACGGSGRTLAREPCKICGGCGDL